jgi:hypothetical protein
MTGQMAMISSLFIFLHYKKRESESLPNHILQQTYPNSKADAHHMVSGSMYYNSIFLTSCESSSRSLQVHRCKTG